MFTISKKDDYYVIDSKHLKLFSKRIFEKDVISFLEMKLNFELYKNKECTQLVQVSDFRSFDKLKIKKKNVDDKSERSPKNFQKRD